MNDRVLRPALPGDTRSSQPKRRPGAWLWLVGLCCCGPGVWAPNQCPPGLAGCACDPLAGLGPDGSPGPGRCLQRSVACPQDPTTCDDTPCASQCAAAERCVNAACIPRCEPVCDDLVAYWPLEEKHGTHGLDFVGGRHGATESLRWQPGPLADSTAADFSTAGILIAPGLPLEPPATIAAWVYLHEDGPQPLIHLEDTTDAEANFGMRLDIQHENRPQLRLGDGQGSEYYHWATWEGDAAVPLGRWFHLLCRFEGQRVDFHLDGVGTPGQFDEQRRAGPPAHDRWAEVTLGYTSEGNTLRSTGISLQGSLDDVRVYDRALEQAEIEELATREQSSAAGPTMQ